jgi:hypothetical protein
MNVKQEQRAEVDVTAVEQNLVFAGSIPFPPLAASAFLSICFGD